MNKKLVSVGILLCFLFLITPIEEVVAGEKDETEISNNTLADSFLVAHVVAKGTGNCTTIFGNFVLGIGYCYAMIVDLEDDGHVKITSLFNPSSSGVVEGSQRLFVIGFAGIRWTIPKVNINGIALFAMSS